MDARLRTNSRNAGIQLVIMFGVARAFGVMNLSVKEWSAVFAALGLGITLCYLEWPTFLAWLLGPKVSRTSAPKLSVVQNKVELAAPKVATVVQKPSTFWELEYAMKSCLPKPETSAIHEIVMSDSKLSYIAHGRWILFMYESVVSSLQYGCF